MHRVDNAVEPVYLKAEIDRLLEKQGNALKVATHIGLTPAEASQCNARYVEISKLLKQLESAEPASPVLGSARGGPTQESGRGTQEGGVWWGVLSTVLKA